MIKVMGLVLSVFLLMTGVVDARPNRVLVFSKTAGFHHESIPAGIKAIQRLGDQHHFEVDTTTDGQKFTRKNLKRYAAIIFLNTTGDVLNDEQQAVFENYIRQGGGYVGVHAAADTEYDWSWYGQLAGAYFDGHPRPQQAILEVIDHNFPGTQNLPDRWEREDEWYNYRSLSGDLQVLIKIDESSYKGGKMGEYHPMCWYHNFDGGRAFYIGMGHTDESYEEPLYLELLYGGIRYAMNKAKP